MLKRINGENDPQAREQMLSQLPKMFSKANISPSTSPLKKKSKPEIIDITKDLDSTTLDSKTEQLKKQLEAAEKLRETFHMLIEISIPIVQLLRDQEIDLSLFIAAMNQEYKKSFNEEAYKLTKAKMNMDNFTSSL